jgi:hypothetical protein
MKWTGHVAHIGKHDMHTIFQMKTYRKKPLMASRHKKKDDIKIDIKTR